MALDFNEVYFYRTSDGLRNIALGVRKLSQFVPSLDREADIYQFLVPVMQEGGRGGRELVAEVALDTGSLVILRDLVWKNEDGTPVEHTFLPLTMTDWATLGVLGNEEISLSINTDSDLREFYRQSVLEDWWTQVPSVVTPPAA